MNSQRIADWVQIATGIVLVLGLVLVLWELRQAKSLTLAELTSQAYAEILAEARTVMGEDSAEAIAKSCHEPDDLSQEELVVLDAYFHQQVIQVVRLRVLEYIEEFGTPWKSVARGRLVPLLSTEHGRWWFRENYGSDPELAAIADEVLREDPNCNDYFVRFAARGAPLH